jgi:hypothetical protein
MWELAGSHAGSSFDARRSVHYHSCTIRAALAVFGFSLRIPGLLINRRHLGWFLSSLVVGVIALTVYLSADRATPGGLTGGSILGMWYGIIGSSLMAYAGALSALRRVPSWWWLGRRSTWLKGHIWLGLLSAVFLLCHSGFRWGGPLELALWIVVILTLATGIFGLLIQQFIPALLTARFTAEAPYEQIPHMCDVLRHKADEEVAGLLASAAASEPFRKEIEQFHRKELRPFLQRRYRRGSLLARPLQGELLFAGLRNLAGEEPLRQRVTLLETYCNERRQWGELERYYILLHGWLLLHVPCSVLVLVLGIAHVVASLYY